MQSLVCDEDVLPVKLTQEGLVAKCSLVGGQKHVKLAVDELAFAQELPLLVQNNAARTV